ncbi:DUF2790 domain-containing protein [Pseudomonas syringae group sp. J309-1]|uniref:DUF2790 domain-containing protein n=1 Tax=Pseudomonas syringae group sp. J309-1 TaxID=3079588 RepID=UPI002915C0FE|nr:DUF2790 domain-containing protein [Pseudomonas syringae group sp. J309-1]MDU8359508.1 DUF2790 domain-containing protein [Pseudomonas syringae group sp. J309-1]
MKIAKSLMLALAVLVPVTSFASSDHEPVASKIIKEHQAFVADYAADKNQALPGIVKYEYGMKLDVEKVVRMSSASKVCGVNPQLMTYEDSNGALNTVKYQALNDCRNKN